MKNLKMIAALLLITCIAHAQTVYYISKSPTASDNNGGTDSAHAYSSLSKITKANAVYKLRKGDVWFEKFNISSIATSSTAPLTITSYGTGAKPLVDNYTKIKSSGWVNVSGNIWKVNLSNSANYTGFAPIVGDMGDVGHLLVDYVIKGAKKSTQGALSAQWDFYSDNVSLLYVYSVGSPNTVGTSIEVATSTVTVAPCSNLTVSGIAFTGCGSTVFRSIQRNNLKVLNCDFYRVGGAYLGTTGTTRFGDAVSLQDGATNVVVDGNSIKQVYDEAMTMQSHSSTPVSFINCIFRNNITDSNQASFNPSVETGISTKNGFVSCKVINNTFKNDGYGWSFGVRPVANEAAVIISNFWNTTQNDLVIKNNTYYNPREGVYYLAGNFSDPRFVADSNDVTIYANVRLRKNYQNGSNPYNYLLADTSAFTGTTGYEPHTKWHKLSSGTTKTYYEDYDGDSHGNASVHVDATSQPAGYVLSNDDCNDSDATVHPGAFEICDGVDNDCDGVIDNGCTVFYHDVDGDGFGSTDTAIAFDAPVGYVPRTGDCDDADTTVYPGAPELCDEKDNNCDGNVDEGCATSAVSWNKSIYYAKAQTGKITVSVELAQTYTSDVKFTMTTIDGTAIANTDYIPQTTQYTIVKGTLSVPVTVYLVRTKTAQPDKFFTLRIISASGQRTQTEATVYLTK